MAHEILSRADDFICDMTIFETTMMLDLPLVSRKGTIQVARVNDETNLGPEKGGRYAFNRILGSQTGKINVRTRQTKRGKMYYGDKNDSQSFLDKPTSARGPKRRAGPGYALPALGA